MNKKYFISDRDKDFINVYYNTLSLLKGKRPRYLYIYLSAIHSPAKRFYVSEEAVIKNIRLLEKGKPILAEGENLLMYIEIHRYSYKITFLKLKQSEGLYILLLHDSISL